ncbi:MAG: hypothetical protein WD096_03795 [Actinomycetota bacterium]
MIRRPVLVIGLGLASVLASCVRPGTTSTAVTPESPSPAASVPAGVPPSFEGDVPAADVPAAALVPLRAQVTGTWFAATSGGEAMIVAWQVPGEDPFRVARGVAAWRRFADGGAPWRPVWGTSYRVNDRVLGLEASTGDVTGDGSDEIVLFAATGGTGTCGSYAVVDLGTGSQIYERPEVCDARLEPAPGIPGLLLSEAVFGPGDPHCCPSGMKVTTLIYGEDGIWSVAGVERSDI